MTGPLDLDDIGLTADPVAVVLRMRAQIDALVAGMTAEERADLAQYEQPTRPNLKAVA